MGNRLFFESLGFLSKVLMGNHQILDFFGSNSLLVVARVARARSPGRRPTKEGALQSARSALFCQATNEGGTATKNARKRKEKEKE